MDSAAFPTHLRDELDAFAACLGGDLDSAVEHCGDWTLYDLANHLGGGNLWAAAAITEGHGDFRTDPAPRERAELIGWFRDTAAILVSTVDIDPDTPAWTFFPPHTVGFWRRRRCHETLVHRWDAEHALGIVPVLDPTLAGDGIAEVIDTMSPRQVARGRATPPEHAIRLTATDTGGSWTLGPGEPVATIRGTAQDLLLTLWNRRSIAGLTVDGDEPAARRVLEGPLVP
ncbi:uncharacterized protein (TIGR03083 family) [Herbihabitans rhizosphaerae]|uniref:Uncharacterized protein (TIGR03083 family) n=1 Tax=Herbihabitans rhizosphaerae TaxID=1872711 RepID=A0A4Q7L609_9PSEU|nr:maleylpyruvate isomerase family mycothiol-dependent enzyme [Herbihabitans rhizosphaerae]RZS45108.1 uncharacterized protein (TIGR03083 family) [Herbihabitans rhizosphaerae]